MGRIRLILMFALLGLGLIAAPSASASSVTNAEVDLYQPGSGAPVSQVIAGSDGGLRVEFQVTQETAGGDMVTITGPEGAEFDAALASLNLSMTNVTTNPGSSSNTVQPTISPDGRSITVEVPSSITVAPTQVLRVNIAPFSNLVTFGTVAGPNSMRVSTNKDTTPATTSPYLIVAADPVAPIAVDGAQSTALGQNFKPMRVGLEDEYGNPVAGQDVTATVAPSGASGTFPGGQDSAQVETGENGQALLPTLTANDILGSWTLGLEGPGGLTSSVVLTNLEHTEAASVEVTLSPASVPADGTAPVTVEALITDEFGNPVPGEDVSVTSNGGQTFTPVEDRGAGVYESQLTASTSAGPSTITVTDTSTAAPVSGTATLTQTPLPARTIELTLAPGSLPADSRSTTTAKAVVRDRLGNPVDGAAISITSTGDQSIAPVKAAGQGVYTSVVTAGTSIGTSELTAAVAGTSPAVSGSASLSQTQPPAVRPPRLKFVSPPRKRVRSAKVRFKFKVISGQARGFQCRLDKKKWARCKSPKWVKLRRGKHVFRVRGIATDGSFGKAIVRKIRRVG